MQDIKLNFINRSNDSSGKDIVIYQSNEGSMSHNEIPIAWKVIKNCGINESHSFQFDPILEVTIGDEYVTEKTPIDAIPGRVFEMVESNFGADLQISSRMTNNPSEFEVVNNLRNGSYNASCLRNGRLLATREGLYPKDSVLFRFSNTICIGVAPDIEEGEEIDISLFGDAEVEFDLGGVTKADIIMTGGGMSENDPPIMFTMENIKRKMFGSAEFSR